MPLYIKNFTAKTYLALTELNNVGSNQFVREDERQKIQDADLGTFATSRDKSVEKKTDHAVKKLRNPSYTSLLAHAKRFSSDFRELSLSGHSGSKDPKLTQIFASDTSEAASSQSKLAIRLIKIYQSSHIRSWETRKDIIRELGEGHHQEAVPFLCNVLLNNEEDWGVRKEAAIALGIINDPSALPFLEQAAILRNRAISTESIYSIARFQNQESLTILIRLLTEILIGNHDWGYRADIAKAIFSNRKYFLEIEEIISTLKFIGKTDERQPSFKALKALEKADFPDKEAYFASIITDPRRHKKVRILAMGISVKANFQDVFKATKDFYEGLSPRMQTYMNQNMPRGWLNKVSQRPV